MSRKYAPAAVNLPITIITWFCIALFIAFLLLALIGRQGWSLFPAAMMALVLFIAWQLRPRHYEVTDTAVVIPRGWPFRTITIPYSEIREARPIRIPALTVRSFGNGGLFGWEGWHWNRELGNFFVEATSTRNTVLIAAGTKYVITPDRPDEFVADLSSRVTP